jgi:hypothetical protein
VFNNRELGIMMRDNKTCAELIRDKYEYTINQIKLINRIDDPGLSFKDLMNIVDDMGYDIFDYVTREHNINNNIEYEQMKLFE